jgi:hypothetical protein
MKRINRGGEEKKPERDRGEERRRKNENDNLEKDRSSYLIPLRFFGEYQIN